MAEFSVEDLNAHFAYISFESMPPSLSRYLEELGNEENECFNFYSVKFIDL